MARSALSAKPASIFPMGQTGLKRRGGMLYWSSRSGRSVIMAVVCLLLVFSDTCMRRMYKLGIWPWVMRDHTLDCTRLVRVTRRSAALCSPVDRDGWDEAIMYSAGVGDDIEWEKRMHDRFGSEHVCWDPTPTAKQWRDVNKLPKGFMFYAIGLYGDDGNVSLRVPFGQRRSYALATRPEEQGPLIKVAVLCLRGMMRKRGDVHVAVLKMDVEGAEFAVIDMWWRRNEKIAVDQIVVEFHERYFDWLPGQRKLVKRSVAKMRELGFRSVASTGTVSQFIFLFIFFFFFSCGES